jgi:hypothetical protein
MAASPDSLAERMGRLGFRKWYERELLSGHAHLVLCILGVVAVLASVESFRDGPTIRLENVLFAIVSGAIGLWALRRFVYLTMRAEAIANQAVCAACGEYGRFAVVGQNPSRHETEVCCRKCSHRWVIDTQD